MKKIIFAVGLLTSVAFASSHQNLNFSGSKNKIGDLNKEFKAVEVSVFEPHEKTEIKFKGISLKSVLEKAYGKDWDKNKNYTFVCLDGYRSQFKTADLAANEGYLVSERVGNKDFTLKTDKGDVKLGPYFLVWKTVEGSEMRNTGHWPWQIKEVVPGP